MAVEPPGFRRLVEGHSRSLLRSAWLLTGDWGQAEDLLQVALVKTWQRWNRIDSTATPEAYVRRVLYSTFVTWRRRRWHTEIPSSPLPDLAGPDVIGRGVLIRDALRTGLLSLPPRQRAIIALRYFEDLSETETARVLGCTVGTVKNSAFKAMVTLRKQPALREFLIEEVSHE